jgi:hypothetical protein
MMENGRKFLIMLFLAFVMLGALQAVAAESVPGLLPAGLVMQESFKPGFGADVGLVQKTTERVALVHAQEMIGYWARINLPVFMKDAVITPTDGRAILQFRDESTVAISADTKLVINRSIFDPDKKERSSFLDMAMGKARFFIKKLPGFARSEFKVKTKTLVAGVRGSDFVITAYPDHTEVATLDDTELELISLAAPEQVQVLHSFERTRVFAGRACSTVEKISPVEADGLKKELPMPVKTEEKGETLVKEAGTKEVKGVAGEVPAAETGETAGAETGQAPATEAAAPLLNVQQETVVLLDQDDLASPIAPIGLEAAQQPLVPEIIEQTQVTAMEQEAGSQQEDIQQDVAEDTINETVTISPLPDMPGTPQ